MFKTLVSKPGGHVEGALPMMAEHDNVFLGIEFLVGTGWHLSHRHQCTRLDVSCEVLPGFADIDQPGLVFAEKRSCTARRNFVIEHVKSLRDREHIDTRRWTKNEGHRKPGPGNEVSETGISIDTVLCACQGWPRAYRR